MKCSNCNENVVKNTFTRMKYIRVSYCPKCYTVLSYTHPDWEKHNKLGK